MEADRRFVWRIGIGSDRDSRGGLVEERRGGRERESVGGRRRRRSERASEVEMDEERLVWMDGVGGGAAVVAYGLDSCRWLWGSSAEDDAMNDFLCEFVSSLKINRK